MGVFMLRNSRWSRHFLDLLANEARTAQTSSIRVPCPLYSRAD
jgi:hypothetical protein